MSNCVERFGDAVEQGIGGRFGSLGSWVGSNPKRTIMLCIALAVLTGVGFMRWETENRGEKLWVPQGTTAEDETEDYEDYFESTSRFNSIIVERSDGGSILTKESLIEAMKMHTEIETRQSVVDGTSHDLVDLCVSVGGACATAFGGVCSCLVSSILKQWNYNLTLLENDDDVLTTVNNYGTREDLESVLGNPVFDETNDQLLVSADAFTLNYFLEGRSVVKDGTEQDPVNEGWEKDVFLDVAETVPETYGTITVEYFAGRSFADEFGGSISGDLMLVQVSYFVCFFFLAATMGYVKCGPGSRWTLALGALVAVGLATASGFGLSSLFGLFFGPVHSLLPFILLGIGVDDAFVIVNAFNQERKVKRSAENDGDIAARCSRALTRAGASITVTSLTDLVAFAISSSSRLPALASFCAYAAIAIFFLFVYASTFFSATLVLDERRQRDNRRECVCCLTRGKAIDEDAEEEGYQEGIMARYFRKYHGPVVLSKAGKIVILAFFAGLLGFGFYGTLNLEVEDTEREFIPAGSYLADYFETADEYFPSEGVEVFFTFEDGAKIYANRQELADLESRLAGRSETSPFLAEPVSEEAYRNVMDGLQTYLATYGSDDLGGVALGDDGWPTSEEDFYATLNNYASFRGPGAIYAQDVAFSDETTTLRAIRVKSEFVRLTKTVRGEIIDDADRQIESMDDTRKMVSSWTDLQPVFPYSAKFITIEGFKIIKRELFQNVGLAIAAVGLIVFVTVASPVTALIITVNVAFCIIEILGFAYALGIVIDSVSVINVVLAVGLSVDYSAHIGHCFMTKGGMDKDKRALESLADIGAAVLQGAMSTFLAVAVLLFSDSYVFEVLSKQFALTVALGVLHGLVLLPVLLSLLGPKPFASAEDMVAGKQVIDAAYPSTDEDPINADDDDDSGDEVKETAKPVADKGDLVEVEA